MKCVISFPATLIMFLASTKKIVYIQDLFNYIAFCASDYTHYLGYSNLWYNQWIHWKKDCKLLNIISKYQNHLNISTLSQHITIISIPGRWIKVTIISMLSTPEGFILPHQNISHLLILINEIIFNLLWGNQ